MSDNGNLSDNVSDKMSDKIHCRGAIMAYLAENSEIDAAKGCLYRLTEKHPRGIARAIAK